MKIFKKILKKFHSQKGITGTDVAAAIIIISATVGVITGVYINVTNGSKENIRYSAATKIVTQVAENIEAMSYDELASVTTLELDASTADSVERKVLGVTIPKGYSIKVTESEFTSDLDIIKEYNIEASYRVGKDYNDSVSVQVVKKRELLEQTNEPDLYLIPNYSTNSYIYPIKKTSTGYVVTTTSDKDWYNYDDGYYANVYVSTSEKKVGATVTPLDGEKYVWIPRFGKSSSTQLATSNLTYLYGTSKHSIVFKNLDVSKNFYSYTVDYSDGSYTDAAAYVADTFVDNDGLTGMWYLVGADTNSTNCINAYDALTSIVPIQN